MSVKTRIEALEKRLAEPEPEETIVRVRVVEISSREGLRAAGTERAPPRNRPVPRGRVRIILEDGDAPLSGTTRGEPTQDEPG